MSAKENIEDFLVDEEFIRWIKSPDKELNIFWVRWIQLNPDKREVLTKARDIVLNTHFDTYVADKAVGERVLDTILTDGTSNHKRFKRKSKSVFFSFGKIAAALVFLAALVVFVKEYNKSQAFDNEVEINEVVTNITKYNPFGKKSMITLPDGSVVWLNSGSKLSYPSKFAIDERIVQLEGQAFFEVKKDSARPFRVNSSGLITTALGTSFDVNSYSDFNDTISISLVTGKIAVKNKSLKSNEVVLPGEQLIYSIKNQKSKIRDFDVREVVSWKERRLYFKNASLREVVLRLERWYGVKVTLQNRPGKDWKLNGEFEKMSLEDVLKSISFSKNFRFTIGEKEITLMF